MNCVLQLLCYLLILQYINYISIGNLVNSSIVDSAYDFGVIRKVKTGRLERKSIDRMGVLKPSWKPLSYYLSRPLNKPLDEPRIYQVYSEADNRQKSKLNMMNAYPKTTMAPFRCTTVPSAIYTTTNKRLRQTISWEAGSIFKYFIQNGK